MTVTVQQLWQRHFERFATRRPLSLEMLNAARRMRDCRTAAMGGHVKRCPQGHVAQVAYNSCRHRCCPLCNGLARARWLEGWKQRLLNCPHYHLVFTTPHELLPLWRYNKARFASTLFAAASQTLTELLDDPKYLGARVGLLAALHTWSQTLAAHVHLHVLVTAGGLDRQGDWRQPVKSCLLPRKVLMIVFRGKFRALLLEQLRRGELVVPPDTSAAQVHGLLNKLGRTPWNVKILDRYAHGRGVVTYLARYLKGGPIGRGRLLCQRDGQVYFRYRVPARGGSDPKRQGVMSLAVDDFLARLLEHVPPHRYQTVRGYGLYSGNQHSRLEAAHRTLGSEPPQRDQPPLSWQAFCAQAGEADPGRCPVCRAELVVSSFFARGRSPPGLPTLSQSIAHIGVA